MAHILTADRLAEIVAWRRDIHQFPELAFQESRTSSLIADKLREWGYDVDAGLAKTGVVGTLRRGTAARSVGLRADMDALPIAEETNLPYASIHPGRMHACGHDGHVAMLLGAAREAAEMDFNGTLRVIFQPAEENEAGARVMIEEGLFARAPVDRIYAVHNWPALAPGQLVANDGAMMAALGLLEIELEGRGAHGAMPHEGADVLVAASAIVSALQTVISRNVSPARSGVVSVTQIHGGDTWNVLPQSAVIRGTTRWFDDEVGQLIDQRIRSLVENIAQGYGCRANIMHEARYPATINDPQCSGVVRASAARLGLEVREADPSMAAEDFAFMLHRVPGSYFWLGSGRSGSNPGLHSPHFDFNDDIIEAGVDIWMDIIASELA